MRDEVTGYRPSIPLHVVWLATQACGLRCAHCSSNAGRALADELSTSEATHLIDELAGAGVVDLAISGGEPLLRPDMLPLVAHAKSRGFSVGLGSSGVGVGKHLRGLAAAGLDRLQISLDGTEEEHDALRGRPGLHAIVLAAIQEAISAGLRVTVCCTVHRQNRNSIEDVLETALSLGVARVNISRFVPTGRGTCALDMSAGEWREVVLALHLLQRAYAGRVQIVTHLAQRILVDADLGTVPGFAGCQAGRGQACIASDGSVWPCVMLPLAIGNVRSRGFADLWRSAPLIRMLGDRTHLQGACGDCAVRDRCGGCRAVAFAHTGDPLATDPRCWIAPSRGQCLQS